VPTSPLHSTLSNNPKRSPFGGHPYYAIEHLEPRTLLSAVTSGQEIGGSITSSTQQDKYTFSAFAGGIIEASIGDPGSAMQLLLQLFNPSGTLLQSVTNTAGKIVTATAAAAVTGTYYALITSANGSTGAYEFSAASVPGTQYNNPIISGEAIARSINGELDTYDFSASAGTIEASIGDPGSSMQVQLELFGPSGQLLKTITNPVGQITTTTTTVTASGTYYVIIKSVNGSTGAYDFSVASVPGTQYNNTIVSGQGIARSIEGELDTYDFSATAGGTIEASIGDPGSSMNVQLELFDPSGNQLKSIANSAGQIVAISTTAATSGIYYVVIKSTNGSTGSYEFSVASVPAAQYNIALVSGEGIARSIEGELDTYDCSATAGGTIEASIGDPGSSMDLQLELFDPSGNQLKSISNTSGQVVTTTTTAATSGTYYIVIKSTNGSTGSYEFSVASVPGAQYNIPIVSGQSVARSIEGELDTYDFAAAAGEAIEASIGDTGSSMQLQLELFNPAGILLQSVVDTAGQTDNVTTTAPASGTYYAVIKSVNGLTGPYLFSILTGFSPDAITKAYGLNELGFGPVSADGAGQTIAIIDAYNDPDIDNDLTAFDSNFDFTAPPNFTVLNEQGTPINPATQAGPPSGAPWALEIDLDVEWAHALAPGANILLVEENNTQPSDLQAAIAAAVTTPSVSVVSMSFTLDPETTNSISTTELDDYFLTPTGHQPIVFVAASGDNGAYYDAAHTIPGPSYPAASNNVLAVGGTSLSLNADGSWNSESGWSGSGNGINSRESLPSYQNGIVPAGDSGRVVPDVAFDANPTTGVSIYDAYDAKNGNPAWVINAGTSFATPAWAALIAIVDQGRAQLGEASFGSNSDDPSQDIHARLYALPSSDFHKIDGVNFDSLTGLGTPVANLLVPDLIGIITETWIGGTSENWSTPSNWSAGVVPNSETDIIFNGGNAVVSSTITVRELTLDGGNINFANSIGGATVFSLTIEGGASLDLANNRLTIRYGSDADPIASIAAWIKNGYNGGAWNGNGIFSSVAAANSLSYGLGYADSADAGNPANLAPDTIEIKYTLLGDANLNGVVDGTDFAIVAANFNKGVSGWDQGDFNYDGVVDGTDFSDLAANFNKGASGADTASADASKNLLADSSTKKSPLKTPPKAPTAPTRNITKPTVTAKKRRSGN
jgi:hypothetical protein